MPGLQTDVRYIKGIGETRAKALNKLGIFTLRDLISYFPRTYEDRTLTRPIRELILGENACVRAMIAAEPTAHRIRGGKTLVKARAVDESGSMDVVFFNQEYRKSSLHTGQTYVFYGKVEGNLIRRQMVNPILEPEGQQMLTGRIMPIYPLTAGVSQLILGKAVRQGLDACRELMADILPDDVRLSHQLCYANYAYENIHFPTAPESLEVARRRLSFEELFLLTCGLSMLRQRRRDVSGPICHTIDMTPFYDSLPFPLTNAQKSAINDATSDMVSGKPMNRLCQGDVGSGKTMVAAACVWFAAQNGWQSALMAPTEILAHQHYDNLASLFARFGLRCALLTGSTRVKERREILSALQSGEIDLCIGTHALLTADVSYYRLGLVITDEQHRFGVAQRAKLWKKNTTPPHVLVMTATPIPRTLAMTVYGDLDVSVIDQLPPGRKPVTTIMRYDKDREWMYHFVGQELRKGRQAYIVYPLIEENEKLDLLALEEGYELIKETFPHYNVAYVHGRMKPAEKDHQMELFASHKSHILVATTVIEVGVNVPNASIMVIENAERFGLSQLHQLRGRVGRGADQSFCVLMTKHELSRETRHRLEVMTSTNDGFVVAEEDMKLRGPGDMEGTQQSGIAFNLKISNLAQDGQILQMARDDAEEVLRNDPTLSSPEGQLMDRQIHELFNKQVNWSQIS